MKIHYCCGDVYLDGYINIDIRGWVTQDPETGMPETNPSVLANITENCTTLDKYYKRPFVNASMPPTPRSIVCDELRDIKCPDGWPWSNASVDEIVMICCVEHFEPVDMSFIVKQAKRVLKPGGQWKVDFPDIKKTVQQFIDSDPEWCMRLLYCNHKNEYSRHEWGYTAESWERLLGDGWSRFQTGCIVEHDYPCIGVTATRG